METGRIELNPKVTGLDISQLIKQLHELKALIDEHTKKMHGCCPGCDGGCGRDD